MACDICDKCREFSAEIGFQAFARPPMSQMSHTRGRHKNHLSLPFKNGHARTRGRTRPRNLRHLRHSWFTGWRDPLSYLREVSTRIRLEGATSSADLDASTVILRLEEAGRTLLALPNRGCRPADTGSGWPAVVHDFSEAYGYGEVEVRAPIPSPQAITRMDEALQWVGPYPRTEGQPQEDRFAARAPTPGQRPPPLELAQDRPEVWLEP